MKTISELFFVALAPIVWGTSYYIITEFLPYGYPMTVATLRALPAGILLLLIVRKFPKGVWIFRSLILGALNFSFFWSFLIFSAYRLPGGVAATFNALQPMFVIFLSWSILKTPIRTMSIVSAVIGVAGVSLMVLTPEARLDPLGILTGIGGAASMATGVVLTRHWKPPVGLLTFTAWQLTAGGLLLLPVSLILEPPLPDLNNLNVFGFAYLGLLGSAITYILWFRGIARINPNHIASLGFLSPLTAVIVGWILLGQTLNELQLTGVLLILASIWIAQKVSFQEKQSKTFVPEVTIKEKR